VQLQVEQERTALDRELGRRASGRATHACANEVNRKIIEDEQTSLVFARSSQNVATAAARLEALPMPTMPEEQRAHKKMRRHV